MKLIIDIPEEEYKMSVLWAKSDNLCSPETIWIAKGLPYEEKPKNRKGDCEKCDFRKFTETFVDGVVDVMNKNGITSVEQLSEILKGGAE